MSSSFETAQVAGDSGQTGDAPRPDGKALGKYEIQKKIGAGGMGTVFLAIDSELKRTVALKVLTRERAQNPVLVRRFKAEGQAAAHLRHENLVTVFEAGEIDGYLYIALEYVDGIDVHRLVEKRGPVPVKRSIAIIRQVARALDHAHEQNIVHRDIKPSNLLIQRDGSVKLTDFGLARSLDEETETDITRAGTTVGTVDYMSPEQARDSKAADIRSDIYSLGCTWYHMLAGEPPYPEGSVTNKLQAHATAALPDPRDTNESVPEGVVAILHRMMAKDPDARYQTPRELLADLDSPVVNRQSLSTNVLAALAEGDSDGGEPAGVAPVRSRAGRRSPAAAEARASAGPARAAPAAGGAGAAGGLAETDSAEVEPAERRPLFGGAGGGGRPDPETIKYLIVGLIVLAALALITWVVVQFASTIDTPSNTTNPFARDEVPRYGSEPDGGQVRGPGVPQANTEPPDAPDTAEPEPLEGTASAAAGPIEPDREVADAGNVEAKPLRDAPPADAAVPLPGRGIEAAVPVRTGEQVPSWVAEAGQLARPATGSDEERLPVLTVGRAAGGPAQFARLEAALSRVPRTGGIVQIVGPGPFELTPTRIAVEGPLVLEAAGGERPVVVLLPSRDGSGGRILQVDGGSLALVGLDFLVVGRQFPASQELALVEVLGGGLSVRGCTVSQRGGRPGATVAFRALDAVAGEERPAAGRIGNPSCGVSGRVLLDRVFVRGPRITALAVARRTCEVVVNNCLLVAGEGPVVAVSEGTVDAAAPRSTGSATARSLRLFSTTAVSSRSGFLLEHSRGEPPDTLVDLTNSVVAAPVGADAAILVELGSWPGADRAAGTQLAPRNLKFTLASSAFPGWRGLIRSAARPEPLTGAAAWTQVWRQLVRPEQFPEASWPRLRFEPADAQPEQFDAAAAAPAAIRGTDGEPPGCLTSLVPAPHADFVRRAEAVAERPLPPADFDTGPLGSRTIPVDLSKQDLAAIVSGGDWPGGARFVATGSGEHAIGPIEVRGKSLSIEFVQGDGPPLWITPRAASFGGGQSLFTVEDGTLRLTGGRFRVPASERGDVPRWLVHVIDGDFALNDCHALGPTARSRGWEGFFRWEQRERPETPEAPGRYEQYARVTRSYVCGHGTLLRADMRGRAFVARDSVLAAADDAFRLDIRGDDPRIHASVELAGCTLSADGTFFDVQATRRGGIRSPLRFYVEQTVFAPLRGSAARSANGPVLFRDAAGVRRQQQLEWWGSANGYAEGFAVFLVESSASGTAPQSFAEDWQNAWGAAGELRPLAEPGAVLLAGNDRRPPIEQITPRDFALAENSQARTWTADGRAIGADVQALGGR